MKRNFQFVRLMSMLLLFLSARGMAALYHSLICFDHLSDDKNDVMIDVAALMLLCLHSTLCTATFINTIIRRRLATLNRNAMARHVFRLLALLHGFILVIVGIGGLLMTLTVLVAFWNVQSLLIVLGTALLAGLGFVVVRTA